MGNQPTSLSEEPLPNSYTTSTANKRSTLDLFAKKLSLNKLNKFSLKRKTKKGAGYYPVPPNAERPSPPSGPEVFQDQDQYFILRWDPPAYDGGCPIIGYIIQHLELGLPQLDVQDQDDTEAWYSSDPGQITQTECILNNLVPGTTYQFRIVAENLLGYSNPSDVSEPIVFNPHGELDDWFYSPSFTCPLEDSYTCMEHEMLTLTVELKGQPYPLVRWYDKNDQDLSKTSKTKYKLKSNGYTRTLVINSVDLADAGVLKCVGSNKEGFTECSTLLKVEAPPRIKRVHSPEFLQNPYDVNEKEEERLNSVEDDYEDLIFQAGEFVRLKFFYSGSPKPEVLLFHNGESVRDPRIVTEFTEKVITVRVENIMRCDRGEWLVKLENVLGEDCTSVLITITDHPSSPGAPEILQLSDNTCILRWPEPQDDGGCPVHNYIVEYFRSEWGVWLKALTSKVSNAKIKDLIPGSKYRFRVKAENLYGVGEASEESVEILITDLPSTRNSGGENGGLMTTVEEAVEEEGDEENKREKEEEELLRPPPIPARQPSPQIPRKTPQTQPQEKPPLYSRGDLIKSSLTSDYLQPPYLQDPPNNKEKEEKEKNHLLLSTPSYEEDTSEYEYDFEKLQREYEEEMRMEDSDEYDEDFETIEQELDESYVLPKEDDEEMEEKYAKLKREWEEEDRRRLEAVEVTDTSVVEVKVEEKKEAPSSEVNPEVERIKREILGWEREQSQPPEQEKPTENVKPHEKSPPPPSPSFMEELEEKLRPASLYQEESERPRFTRSIRSEERGNKPPLVLSDKFTDYLTMKVSSRDKRIGSSLRSLTSQTSGSDSKSQSRENLRRLIDFDDYYEEKVSPKKNTFEPTKPAEKEDEEIPTLSQLYVRHSRESPPKATPKYEATPKKARVLIQPVSRPTPPKEEPKTEPEVEPEVKEITPPSKPISRYLILLPLFFIDIYLTIIVLILLLFWNKYSSS